MKSLHFFVAFLFVFLPFQFALNISEDFDVAVIRIYILFLYGLFLALSLWHKEIFIARGWISGLLFFFCTWALFSLTFSPVPFWTLRKIIFLYSFLPLFYIATFLFVTKKTVQDSVIRAWIYGAGAISAIGIIQFFMQFITSLQHMITTWSIISPIFLGNTFSDSVIENNSWLVHVGAFDMMRSIAFFPDPHIFSFYCGLSLPYAIYLFIVSRNAQWLICSILILCADLLTFSRGGYVGLFFGSLIFIVLSWNAIVPKIRNILYAFFVFFLLSFFLPHNIITQRFISSFDPTDTSNSQRVELWSEAWHHIMAKPFLGTGLGAYAYTVDPIATYRTPIYAHNLFLDVTVELGLVGGFVFCALFFRSLHIFYRYRHHTIAFFGIISLCIFLAHSIFDTPLFSVHIFPILLLIFAFASYYENMPQKNH